MTGSRSCLMASFGIPDADISDFLSMELIVLKSTEIIRKVSHKTTAKL
jgi:hypothetical protein